MSILERLQIFSGLFALITGIAVYLVKGRAWMASWRERRLRQSAAIREVYAFMRASNDKHEQLTDSIGRVHRSVLRLTLFGPTTSRRVHEQQLDAGKEYLDLGGNGPAAAQYEALYQDYIARTKSNDWNYKERI